VISYYYQTAKQSKHSLLKKPKDGCWVHIDNASTEKLEKYSQNLNLDFDIVKDILDPFEVSRLEKDDDTTYIFTRIIDQTSSENITIPLLVIHNHKYFVTIFPQSKTDIFHPLITNSQLNTTNKTKLLVKIFNLISQNYQKTIDLHRKNIQQLTSNLEKMSSTQFTNLVHQESALNEILTALEPTTITIQNILSGKIIHFEEDDHDDIEDLVISNNQLIQICRMSLKSIASIREAYSTYISNNLNHTIKILTALTVILTIPTIISSFFGMNVPVPLGDHPLAFVIILSLTISTSIILSLFLVKKDLF